MSHPGAVATLVRLRWLSIAGQALALWLVPRLLPMHLPWLPMAAGVLVLFAFNVWAQRRAAVAGSGTGSVLAHLAVDVAALAWQLYWSGGPANPFVSLFVVPIALATALLPVRAVIATAVMAVAAYSLLWFDHAPLPHVHGEFDLHLLGMWLNFLLTAAVLAVFGSRIAAELARQRAALAAERERAARDEGLLAVATLAAGAAHALNTPLATLSVLLADLREGHGGGDPIALQEDLALMAAQVDACRGAVGQLVADARPDAEAGPAEPLSDRLASALARWRLLRPGVSVGISMDEATAAVPIAAGRDFDLLVLSLLDNAAEASRAVGSERVGLSVRRDGGRLVLGFSDDGPGLDRPPVPFTSGRPGGLGLGYALAARVCERYGGALQPVRGGIEAGLDTRRLEQGA